MKRYGVLALLLLFALPLCAQTKPTRADFVQHLCHAPEVTSGPEFKQLKSIRARLGPIISRDKTHQIHVALVDRQVINAWDNNLTPTQSLICTPVGMVRFMGDGEGELAFILSHEVGDAIDDVCKSGAGRASVTKPTISGALNQLLGGSGRNPSAEQKTCGAKADEIGFRIFVLAGFNPFDAAGAFGRLEMYLGDTSTGVLARLAAIGNDHPITPDRIRHMRLLLAQLTAQR
jgi:predicted Zn-dependent protease